MKIDMQQLLANQDKAEADRMANQARMEAKMEANQAKATKQEEMLAEISARMDTNLNDMREEIKCGQAKIRSTVCAIRSKLEETIQHEMKGVLLYVEEKTQNLCRGLTETIEKTQMELQTVEVSLDKRTRDVEEMIASIREDITSNR
jgi:hypothetical protein